METYKIVLPWLLRQSRMRKWIKERLLRVPQEALHAAANAAGVTPEQWRSVERVQAELVQGNLELRLG